MKTPPRRATQQLGIALVTSLLMSSPLTAVAQDPSPTCSELVWSAQLLATNPDIKDSCQGVYERNNTLYAKATIELTRVRGNRLTFRTIHTDGSKGAARSITVPSTWRAEIDGRGYRAGELLPGQRLNIYIPEDRFALALHDGEFDGDEELLAIEEAEVVTAMPKTASQRYNLLALGLASLLVALGLTAQRLRRATVSQR